MSLQTIITTLEGYAETALQKIEDEGKIIVQELEPVIESAFTQLCAQFGELAVQTVVNLMTAAGESLSGSEKLNLTATTITDAAIQAGKQALAADVTALAKNAYEAVLGKAAPVAQP